MKFRKVPVVITAIRWKGKNLEEVLPFVGENYYIDHNKIKGGLIITTLEGEQPALPGDYIIRGIQGEFYPCKPDVFERTYEAVKDSEEGTKYRKKPVEVEAVQWDGNNLEEVLAFLISDDNYYVDHNKVEGGLVIKTPYGEHLASIGDYIVKGVQGEFYPCKPDIFEDTYEVSNP